MISDLKLSYVICYMTRKEINYTNTIIYKIVCNDLTVTDVYVGCTTDLLEGNQNIKKYVRTSTTNNIIQKYMK